MEQKVSLKNIQNTNNKLNADMFLHLFTSMGKLKGLQIEDMPDFDIDGKLWRIYDIGKCELGRLPKWMGVFSHNLDHDGIARLLSIDKKTEINFVIFRRKEVGSRN